MSLIVCADGSGACAGEQRSRAPLTEFSYSVWMADPATTDGEGDETVVLDALDPGIDVARIEAEEAAAAYRVSMIQAGRRKGGLLGAATAGAMIGLRDVYEGPPKQDDIVIEIEASGKLDDIDVDGIAGTVDDVDFWAPPPPGQHPAD
jgi:hypothetical protein